ncbi:hypothetical protein, partial [Streptomyces sp. NPDC001100]
ARPEMRWATLGRSSARHFPSHTLIHLLMANPAPPNTRTRKVQESTNSPADAAATTIRDVNSRTTHDDARPGSEKSDPGRAVVTADRAAQKARVSGGAAS